MRINTLTVSYSDIGRLLSAIEKCGVTPPKQLTDVLSAHEKLTATPSSVITDPVKMLVTAALDGHAGADRVDKSLERAAIARLVAEERRGLTQRVEPALLAEFGRRLENGGADAVLDLLRPQFSEAASALGAARDTVGIPDNAEEFVNTASADELLAWQSMRPAIETLDRVAMIARAFGPCGPFPTVPDPRSVDPAIRCGWLHDIATMCTDGALLDACAAFQRPSPLGDVKSSPWLGATPFLHTIASASERLRRWAESAWAAQEAERATSGRLINGVVVPDPPRRNPFTLAEAKAS